MEQQISFFDEFDLYKEHWQDMPEFNNTKKAVKQLIVHFETNQDFEKFKKVMNDCNIKNKNITFETKYMWFK